MTSPTIDQNLWNAILKFKLDEDFSQYTFSLRLAAENFWTQNFTEKAILEYKKFMYLVAKSESMIAPSPIVDVVWHQHLIYSESYSRFCEILGKPVHHVPSQKKPEEYEQFKNAFLRTHELYTETFGEQPRDVWQTKDLFSSLNLEKAVWDRSKITFIWILAFLGLSYPAFYLLRPYYIHIESNVFLPRLLLGMISAFWILEIVNKITLREILKGIPEGSFIFNLNPYEVCYSKELKSYYPICVSLSKLIKSEKVNVKEKFIQSSNEATINTLEEHVVINSLNNTQLHGFSSVLELLAEKPFFRNISDSIDFLLDYFTRSKAFGSLYCINLAVFSLPGMIGFVRYLTGISRDRPVILLVIILTAFLVFAILYLRRLEKLFITHTIPQFYRKTVTQTSVEGHTSEDWQYLVLGQAIFAPMLIPFLREYQDSTNSLPPIGDSSGSSCSSGCGSSCGSSCGGCGGGGD